MKIIHLASRAYRTLQSLIHSSSNARQVRRAQALVWLHEGASVQTVARRLRLSRQCIYDIMRRYENRSHLPVVERMCDQAHPGRPPRQRQQTQRIVQRLLTQAPEQYGYRSPIWTVPMLRAQVEQQLHRPVSADTVRRVLHRLRYRYKRPRLVLARRAPQWRQAKGG